MSEPRETKIKRLKMRSMRRGIKEMDVILMAYSQAHLDDMSDANLDLYDQMLEENDHDLFLWVSGQQATPDEYLDLITQVAASREDLSV